MRDLGARLMLVAGFGLLLIALALTLAATSDDQPSAPRPHREVSR